MRAAEATKQCLLSEVFMSMLCLFVCLCGLRGAGGGGLKEAEHAAEAAVRQRLAGAGQPRMRAAKTPEAKRIYAAHNRRPTSLSARYSNHQSNHA